MDRYACSTEGQENKLGLRLPYSTPNLHIQDLLHMSEMENRTPPTRLQPAQTATAWAGDPGTRRKARLRSFCAVTAIGLAFTCSNLPAASGSAKQAVTFRSPNGVVEQCILPARIPGGRYSDSDRTTEQAFCAIDFYAGTHALCPKVFSTSPGTLVYDISRGSFAGRPEVFEQEQCATASPVKKGASGEPVSFKTTMNDAHTSATFSTASLPYYHLSRYFHAAVHVPVSVYRSMDRKIHLERVTRRGFALSDHSKRRAMNHAGWKIMLAAEQAPARYSATDELFTRDRKQIYGVLLHPDGDRYGPELNGTRESGWGEGQNRDFQETAPYRALRTEKPLLQAIEEGIHQASRNPTLRKAMRNGISTEQMIFWMQELSEITLLDFIFSQQDRIGNIDYLNYWYWVEDGQVKQMPAHGSRIPESIASFQPVRLKRTQLNDNDAGGRVPYANFSKKTGMLEKIRHYNPDTYQRLLRLAADLRERGEIYAYLRDNFNLSSAQLAQVVKNSGQAADILSATCRAGKLRFDLDPEQFLLTGKVDDAKTDCYAQK